MMQSDIRRKLRQVRVCLNDPEGISKCYGKMHGKTESCRLCQYFEYCKSSMDADRPTNRHIVSITAKVECEITKGAPMADYDKQDGENNTETMTTPCKYTMEEIMLQLAIVDDHCNDPRISSIIIKRLAGLSFRLIALQYQLSRQQVSAMMKTVKEINPSLHRYISQNKMGLSSDILYLGIARSKKIISMEQKIRTIKRLKDGRNKESRVIAGLQKIPSGTRPADNAILESLMSQIKINKKGE